MRPRKQFPRPGMVPPDPRKAMALAEKAAAEAEAPKVDELDARVSELERKADKP